MNVKKGDLAVVVGAPITVELNGRFVEVIRPSVDGEVLKCSTLHLTVMKDGGITGWIVRGASGDLPVRTTNGKLYLVPERAIEDRYLRRISGPGCEDTTDTERPIKLEEPA